MTTFTPGPWTALPVINPKLDGTFLIYAQNEPPTKAFICKIKDGTNLTENARLIAAAPDLLAALIIMHGELDAAHGDTADFSEGQIDALDRGLDAINKATSND